jgi:ammonia channel protein AmtB
VHINAGVAALAVVLVLGAGKTFPVSPRPHSLPLTMLGAGILLFGWFGFNGGSAPVRWKQRIRRHPQHRHRGVRGHLSQARGREAA